MQKLYCYIDESGQDTGGKLFLVSVVITDSQKEKLRRQLEKIEQISKKKRRKWMKSTIVQRKKYIEAIIANKDFINIVSYSKYRDSRAYVDLTILTTAKALLDKTKTAYEATIIVDGLKRTERHRFAAGLRKLKVKVRKVRGIKDQADEFIRLADAIVGLVRDSLEDSKKMKPLYKKALHNKIIKEI